MVAGLVLMTAAAAATLDVSVIWNLVPVASAELVAETTGPVGQLAFDTREGARVVVEVEHLGLRGEQHLVATRVWRAGEPPQLVSNPALLVRDGEPASLWVGGLWSDGWGIEVVARGEVDDAGPTLRRLAPVTGEEVAVLWWSDRLEDGPIACEGGSLQVTQAMATLVVPVPKDGRRTVEVRCAGALGGDRDLSWLVGLQPTSASSVTPPRGRRGKDR